MRAKHSFIWSGIYIHFMSAIHSFIHSTRIYIEYGTALICRRTGNPIAWILPSDTVHSYYLFIIMYDLNLILLFLPFFPPFFQIEFHFIFCFIWIDFIVGAIVTICTLYMCTILIESMPMHWRETQLNWMRWLLTITLAQGATTNRTSEWAKLRWVVIYFSFLSIFFCI